MKTVILWCIRIYQRFVSPIKPPSCRFYPSCSEYAVQAVHKHGVKVGSLLAMKRIVKCGPWHKGGYDPVP